MEPTKMYSCSFGSFLPKNNEMVLKNIRNKKNELVKSKMILNAARIKNLPDKLPKEDDDITFYSDDKLQRLKITNVNFVEIKNGKEI